MNIKDVLAKISKGETLTDEDKAIITDYDPDKAVNSSAAAARKSAEAKLKEKESELQKLQDAIELQRAEAEEKANANKPELEKLTKEMEKLKKGLADKETSVQQLIQEKRQMVRGGRIGRIMAGLKFVEGLDPEIVRLGIEKALATIGDEDLESEDTVNPILEAFKSKQSAAGRYKRSWRRQPKEVRRRWRGRQNDHGKHQEYVPGRVFEKQGRYLGRRDEG